MEILFVSTELAPYVKVGGLADVIAALPKALRGLGHKTRSCCRATAPSKRAACSLRGGLTPLEFKLGSKTWRGHGVRRKAPVAGGARARRRPGALRSRRRLRRERRRLPRQRDALRRALARRRRDRASSASRRRAVRRRPLPRLADGARRRRTCASSLREVPQLTTQDACSRSTTSRIRGRSRRTSLPALGPRRGTRSRIDGIEFYGGLNVLKQGILTADAVTTVSTTYAREIQTPGARLEARRRAPRARAGASSGSSTASITRCGTRRPIPRSPRATTRRTRRTRRAARARCRRSSGSRSTPPRRSS